MNWSASALARVGFLASDNMLVYGIGGWTIAAFAWDNIRTGGFDNNMIPSATVIASAPTVGGGIEFRLSPHWTLKSEYRYERFSDVGANSTGASVFPSPSGPAGISVEANVAANLDVQTLRLGITYLLPIHP